MAPIGVAPLQPLGLVGGHTVLVHPPGVSVLGLKADSGPAHQKALEVGLGLLGVDGHELPVPQVPQGLHGLGGLLDVCHIPVPVVAAGGLDKALEVLPLVAVQLVPVPGRQLLLGHPHRFPPPFFPASP